MKNIVVNSYRFTKKMYPDEMIEIAGKVFITAAEWCNREAKRLIAKGINARTIRQGNSLVWCVRNRAGVQSISGGEA